MGGERKGSRLWLVDKQRVSFRALTALKERVERLDVAEFAVLDPDIGFVSRHRVAEELPALRACLVGARGTTNHPSPSHRRR